MRKKNHHHPLMPPLKMKNPSPNPNNYRRIPNPNNCSRRIPNPNPLKMVMMKKKKIPNPKSLMKKRKRKNLLRFHPLLTRDPMSKNPNPNLSLAMKIPPIPRSPPASHHPRFLFMSCLLHSFFLHDSIIPVYSNHRD